jgi:hypothetical protein
LLDVAALLLNAMRTTTGIFTGLATLDDQIVAFDAATFSCFVQELVG